MLGVTIRRLERCYHKKQLENTVIKFDIRFIESIRYALIIGIALSILIS